MQCSPRDGVLDSFKFPVVQSSPTRMTFSFLLLLFSRQTPGLPTGVLTITQPNRHRQTSHSHENHSPPHNSDVSGEFCKCQSSDFGESARNLRREYIFFLLTFLHYIYLYLSVFLPYLLLTDEELLCV